MMSLSLPHINLILLHHLLLVLLILHNPLHLLPLFLHPYLHPLLLRSLTNLPQILLRLQMLLILLRIILPIHLLLFLILLLPRLLLLDMSRELSFILFYFFKSLSNADEFLGITFRGVWVINFGQLDELLFDLVHVHL